MIKLRVKVPASIFCNELLARQALHCQWSGLHYCASRREFSTQIKPNASWHKREIDVLVRHTDKEGFRWQNLWLTQKFSSKSIFSNLTLSLKYVLSHPGMKWIYVIQAGVKQPLASPSFRNRRKQKEMKTTRGASTVGTFSIVTNTKKKQPQATENRPQFDLFGKRELAQLRAHSNLTGRKKCWEVPVAWTCLVLSSGSHGASWQVRSRLWS